MKNGKKLLALLVAVILCMALTACTATLEKTTEPAVAEGEAITILYTNDVHTLQRSAAALFHGGGAQGFA